MLGDNFRAEECLKASSAKLSEAKTKLLTNTNYWQIGVCVYCVCNYLHMYIYIYWYPVHIMVLPTSVGFTAFWKVAPLLTCPHCEMFPAMVHENDIFVEASFVGVSGPKKWLRSGICLIHRFVLHLSHSKSAFYIWVWVKVINRKMKIFESRSIRWVHPLMI